MLKLAGAVLVFAAAALYGRGLCEKTKKKLALLEALEDFISYIGESIETLRLPLGPIATHTVQVLMHAIDPAEPMPEPLTIIPELIVRGSSTNFNNPQ